MRSKLLIVGIIAAALTGFLLGLLPAFSPAAPPQSAKLPETTLAPEAYSYDPAVLPTDALYYLGDDYQKYCQLIEAVRWAQETLPFASKRQYEKVLLVFSRFYLPISLLDNSSGSAVLLNEETLVGTIAYQNDRDTQIQLNYNFEVMIDRIIRENVTDPADKLGAALELYRYVASSITYVEDHSISTYQCLLSGQGLCKNYSELYELLLNQLGILCYPAVSASHAWLMVQLDGEWYHMDPTFENSATGGKGLRYFGMTDAERLTSVDSSILYTPFAYYPNSPTSLTCDSVRFLALHNDSYDSFTIDRGTRAIWLYKGKKQTAQIR